MEGKSDPERELRKLAEVQLRKKHDFSVHLVIYIAVNAMLVLIWALTGGPFWPIFPIGGWGIGIAIHAWDVYGRSPITEDRISREAERLRAKGFGG